MKKEKDKQQKDQEQKEGHYPTNIKKKQGQDDGPAGTRKYNVHQIHKIRAEERVFMPTGNIGRMKHHISLNSRQELASNRVEIEGQLGKVKREHKDVL